MWIKRPTFFLLIWINIAGRKIILPLPLFAVVEVIDDFDMLLRIIISFLGKSYQLRNYAILGNLLSQILNGIQSLEPCTLVDIEVDNVTILIKLI